MYEISKTFEFEAAHRLLGHKGKCANLHGHNYKITVFIRSNELNDLGVVMDFSDIKGHMNELIQQWDHSTILYSIDPLVDILAQEKRNPKKHMKIWVMESNPTAENMAHYIYDYLKKKFDKWNVSTKKFTIKIGVQETDGCVACFGD